MNYDHYSIHYYVVIFLNLIDYYVLNTCKSVFNNLGQVSFYSSHSK